MNGETKKGAKKGQHMPLCSGQKLAGYPLAAHLGPTRGLVRIIENGMIERR